MTINILSMDFHVGAMAQHALDHGGDLGGRAALELGIDACSASFDMPVDHDAPSTITRMPFRHQVAITGSELCGICRTGRAGVPPECSIADCQGRIRNPGPRLLDRRGDRTSTRLNSSHYCSPRMQSSAS